MTPIDWATRPLKKYADFSGRAPRAEYWWFALAVIVCYVIVNIVESLLGINQMVLGLYGPLMVLLWLGTLLPQIAVSVRRLHDTNRSGWWLLVVVIPYAILGFTMGQAAASGGTSGLATAGIFGLIALVGAIVLLVFLVLPGNKGDNRFGPDPYAGDTAATAAA